METTIRQIKSELMQAHSVLIFSHQNPDGDAIGSAVAIGLILKEMGKKVDYCMQKDTKGCAELLSETAHFNDTLDPAYDLALIVDCSSYSYIHNVDQLQLCSKTMTIDHHVTNERYADINYVDSLAAATGEIMYLLAEEIGSSISVEIAHAIYIAIVEDTGNFSYSNVTSRTHRVAAELYDRYHDFDYYAAQLKLYHIEKLFLMNNFLNNLKTYHGNRLILGVMDYGFLSEANGDTEGLVDLIRNVKECVLAVFIKESEPGSYKVSMRSRSDDMNVAEISREFDGGGHNRAAGFQYNGELSNLVSYFEDLADRLWTDTY